MTIAWVLGSRGLLGAALTRALRNDDTRLFVPPERFDWTDQARVSAQLAAAVAAFAIQVGTADRWEIYWAAGVGSMGSSAESLVPETQALSDLLQLLGSNPRVMTVTGTICFASSAGAIYAGSTEDVNTEDSTPAPTTAYAIEKLRQEDLIRNFVSTNDRAGALIARISTLYGSGQAVGKRQGLLSHLAKKIVRNEAIQIYVPYDTIRDYIDADDAAPAMVNATRMAMERSDCVVKIISSEYPATIAEIISIFKRIARRPPRIIRSANRLSNLYARRVQFKSIVGTKAARVPVKGLPVGIAQLMAAERLSLMRGPVAGSAPPLLASAKGK